jgi:hypothetical protein
LLIVAVFSDDIFERRGFDKTSKIPSIQIAFSQKIVSL